MKAELLQLVDDMVFARNLGIGKNKHAAFLSVEQRLRTLAGTLPDAQAEPIAWLLRDPDTGDFNHVTVNPMGQFDWVPVYAHTPAQPEPVKDDALRALERALEDLQSEWRNDHGADIVLLHPAFERAQEAINQLQEHKNAS